MCVAYVYLVCVIVQVVVYRLVSGGTVEEKVIERALMKLKLDAVVVQQGRLSDKTKGLTKDDMQAMISFGADTVFRSTGTDDPNACITDADIDTILEIGKSKTRDLTDALAAKAGAMGAGLLDFKIDSSSSQLFEGVDYSAEGRRKAEQERIKALKLAIAQSASDAMGERTAKRALMSYNEQEAFRALGTAGGEGSVGTEATKLRLLLPAAHRPPSRMDPWMFLDAARIKEITAMEVAYLQERLAGGGASASGDREAFPEALIDERSALVRAGFPTWKRADFVAYVKAAAT